MSRDRDGRRAVHEAAGHYFEEGEVVVKWVLVAEVVGQNGARYLATRHGAGHEGQDPIMGWDAVGMLQSASDDAMSQIRDWRVDPPT